MQIIYLDHAATSFPKAPGVPEAMSHYLTEIGGNPGRGSYASATQAELASLNGRRATWFCGSYFGYGFHEDAVRSAYAAAESLRRD